MSLPSIAKAAMPWPEIKKSDFRRLAVQDPVGSAHQWAKVTTERDRLRDALRRARLDVTDVGTSGWDSTRLERTKEAVARIDAALAESEETT